MFKKVLIANRGEIAVRVIRACKELGIKTVAVYSEADKDGLHVQLADEAVCIGPKESAKSYLNMAALVSAAKMTGAEAIHPGFGFLSENAEFVKFCEQHDIVFIGPSAHAMETMGAKSVARETMMAAGVPVVPGSDGLITDVDEAVKLAKEIGYPVMVKASAGGGGKGIRMVMDEEGLREGIMMAQTEAQAAFGDGGVYLEKCIIEPRHIEMQILADTFGNTLYIGERECSIQRRQQKVFEEAPSVAVTDEARKHLGEIAVRAAKAVNYYSVGTIEFLMDKEGNFYFMEMNTRIQVEHPVSEFITGVDLVKEQIKVAAGEKLTMTQDDIKINGWAMECRINAEDPEFNFRPSPGTITKYQVPGGPGVRIDGAPYQGYRIPPYYDSMVSKLIVWAPTRDEAIARMNRALDEYVIEGIKTTIPFHKQLMANEKFQKGQIYTKFVETEMLK